MAANPEVIRALLSSAGVDERTVERVVGDIAGPITSVAQLRRMTPEQIVAAEDAGRIDFDALAAARAPQRPAHVAEAVAALRAGEIDQDEAERRVFGDA